jgi:hypothetical protein
MPMVFVATSMVVDRLLQANNTFQRTGDSYTRRSDEDAGTRIRRGAEKAGRAEKGE